jgi:hypothetical protein
VKDRRLSKKQRKLSKERHDRHLLAAAQFRMALPWLVGVLWLLASFTHTEQFSLAWQGAYSITASLGPLLVVAMLRVRKDYGAWMDGPAVLLLAIALLLGAAVLVAMDRSVPVFGIGGILVCLSLYGFSTTERKLAWASRVGLFLPVAMLVLGQWFSVKPLALGQVLLWLVPMAIAPVVGLYLLTKTYVCHRKGILLPLAPWAED